MSTGNHSNTASEHHFAHHFKNAEHEYVTSKQGIWLFMVTEILMFGAIFAAYGIFHTLYPEMFAEGASHLDWKMGFINTLVLITSSYTMAMSIHHVQKNQINQAITKLIITLVCACIFLLIKYFEYQHKFELGIYPGKWFAFKEAGHANLALYFSFYFVMTGLHGIHVLFGMGLITWVLIRTKRGDFSDKHYTALEGVGIFWHIVDLIWIYLFPILYLIG